MDDEPNAARDTPGRGARPAAARSWRTGPLLQAPPGAAAPPPVATLLVRRLRVTAWVVLGIVLCFAVDDLRVGAHLRWLLSLRAVEAAFVLSVLGLAYRARAVQYARSLAFAGYTGVCLLATVTGSVRGDLASTWVILMTVAGGASVLLPWGGRAQLWAVAVAALALGGSAVAVGGPFGSVLLHPGAAVLGFLLLSIYAARELEAGRRRVEERDRMLQESRRWREALIESLPVTVFRTILGGAEAGAMWHSDNVERLTGFAAGRFAGPDGTAFWSSRVHPDDRAIYLAAMPVLAEHRVATSEYRWQRADGAYRRLLVQAVLLCDAADHPLEVIGSVSDLTEQRQTEVELRERELRYALVAQATNDAIWDWDLASGGVRWNDAVQARFGYPAAAVGGDIAWWSDRIHPEQRERVVGGLRAVIDGGGGTWADEYRWRREDGSYAAVTDRGTVVREADGRAVRMIGAMTDISQRKAAEEALRASETYFRSLTEKGSDLVSVLTVDGTLRYVSPSHRRILGYEPEDLVGRSVIVFLHPDDLTQVSARFSDVREVRDTVTELRFRHADGSYRVLESRVNDLSADPAVGGIVITSRDITDRKRVEVELQRAKEAAEAANRAKSEFLANVSHEIRTPLNGIVGMAQLLAGTALEAEQREYVELLQSSADWLLGVINDILDLAKVEAGKLTLDDRPFAPRASVDEVMRVMAVRGAEKGLVVRWTVADDVPEALAGDAGRLRQILINLVSNAIKFTERGTVQVSVAAGASPGAGPPLAMPRPGADVELHISVADTGIGIPADKLATVFEAFEQVDGSTTRRYGGTGLGLAICRRLVEVLGGRIWADSTFGSGSTFHFTARFVSATTPAEAGRPPAPAAARRPVALARARGALRVLLAEDNAVNQLLAVRLLEKAGHSVVVAADGAAAVAAWQREPFDLVLMDVQMPTMGGFEATAAIRAAEAGGDAHVPIIAMTAHAMSGDAERCLAAGMDGYVAKPVRVSELFDTIARVLDDLAARPAAAVASCAAV